MTSMTPKHYVGAVLNAVPDCLGAALLDLDQEVGAGLMNMQTKDDHPSDVMDLLPNAMHDMMHGPTVREIIEAWGKINNRRTTISYLTFETGNVTHYAQRLHHDDSLCIAVATWTDTNPREVMRVIKNLSLVEVDV